MTNKELIEKYVDYVWRKATGWKYADGRKMPPICEDCGKYYSDPPSRLCPGCEAYQEHQQ